MTLRERLRAIEAKRSDTGIPFCPHKPTPAQAAFLAVGTFEAFYGGAAGGGKSDALLMSHLRFSMEPNYSGLVLRRTLPDLALPGAIMDRAKMWLRQHSSVHWNEAGKIFRFPSGARIQFGFCESDTDVYRYQGAEFHQITIDEVTQWRERSYTYLLSRIRRNTEDKTPLMMRSGGNPGGIGHRWVKERFVKTPNPDRPFIPARLADNPHLNAEEYAKTLENLDEVTRAQLLEGRWIDDTTGLVYKLDRAKNVVEEEPNLDGWNTVLAVDLGASELTPTTAFCIVRWHPDHDVSYAIRSWKEAGMTPTSCGHRIREVMDAYPDCRVTMDEGALGLGYAREMRARFNVPVVPAMKSDKLGAIRLLNGALERAELLIVGEPCEGLLDELGSLVWHSSGLRHDPGMPNHETDALLYAWRMSQSWVSAYKQPTVGLNEEELAYQKERASWKAKRESPWERW